jgi:hypothetical protein
VSNAAQGAALNQPSAMSALQRAEMLKKVQATVPPEMRRFIAQEVLKRQYSKSSKQYYSTVRFAFNVSPVGGDPNTASAWEYKLARTNVIAFSYGNQDSAVAAGFAQDYQATDLDTNLVSKADTGGATVEIHGLSLYLSELADSYLAKLIWANTHVDISLDGSQRYKLLGRMGRIPQGGGLYGTGSSRVITPPVHSSEAPVGSLTNGVPAMGNFLKLERIRWNPASRIDSKFQLRFFTKQIDFTVQRRDAGPGVVLFEPPKQTGALGTYVDVVCYLHTREIVQRSNQS